MVLYAGKVLWNMPRPHPTYKGWILREIMFSINIYQYISISDGDGIGLNFQGDNLFWQNLKKQFSKPTPKSF